MAKISISENKLREIVSENIIKILNEGINNNITINDIEEVVGYNYDSEDPNRLLNDFEVMVEDVLEHAYNNEHGIENMFDSDYKNCNPEMIGTYIDMYREQMNSDYNRMYNELRDKMEKGNEILNRCTQLFAKYKQGK